MTKATDFWFPLYIEDYLRDTMRLDHSQHGAYLLILMDYWIHGAPPDDDSVLATITKSSPGEWQTLRPVVASFFQLRDGRWFHKRVELEKTRAVSLNSARSQAGRAGNAKRWGDRKPIANHIANPSQTISQIDPPSPSPSQIEKKDSPPQKTSPPKNPIAKHPAPSALDRQFHNEFWKTYPRKVGKLAALKAWTKALAGGTMATEIIAGAARLRDDPNRDPAYTPHPATWLNAGRWTDDPLPSRKGNGHDRDDQTKRRREGLVGAILPELNHRSRTPQAGDGTGVGEDHGSLSSGVESPDRLDGEGADLSRRDEPPAG